MTCMRASFMAAIVDVDRHIGACEVGGMAAQPEEHAQRIDELVGRLLCCLLFS